MLLIQSKLAFQQHQKLATLAKPKTLDIEQINQQNVGTYVRLWHFKKKLFYDAKRWEDQDEKIRAETAFLVVLVTKTGLKCPQGH